MIRIISFWFSLRFVILGSYKKNKYHMLAIVRLYAFENDVSKPALLFIFDVTVMYSVDTGLLLEGVDEARCAGVVAGNLA